MEESGNSDSLMVKYLPEDVTRTEVYNLFGQAGTIKRCFLKTHKEAKGYKGFAYVAYKNPEDACKALELFNNYPYQGKILKVKFSKEKTRNIEDENEDTGGDEASGKQKKSVDPEVKREARKQAKKDKNKRKGRIIIRNLSFKADEEAVKNHFDKFGTITEVKVLKKSNGMMVGCAFVQFEQMASALKAIRDCNMKPLLGRPIAVDIAVAKEKFKTAPIDQGIVKVEAESDDEVNVKKEENDVITVKEECISDDEQEIIEFKKEENSSDDDEEEEEFPALEQEESSSEDEDDDDDDFGNEEDNDNLEEKNDEVDSGVDEEVDQNRSFRDTSHRTTPSVSRDVTEGRTLFIKNLSFDATEEDIGEALSTFGDLKYVLLCIDRLTEHPKGTAFVQFKDRKSADNCLAACESGEQKSLFTLHGRQMQVLRAMSRGDVGQKKNKDVKERDKRNLFLAREGMIREGTQAAFGVSKHDVVLRQQREGLKKKMLQNLHTFVSKTRLCVHNLPEGFSDKKLRLLFLKYSPEGAAITEAHVMRDMKNLDKNGIAISRGYGFVGFTEHEHALKALRTINNNPNVFSNEKRPIVEFSLENRAAIKAREMRLQKSKEKNPNFRNDSVNKQRNFTGVKNQSGEKGDVGEDPTFMGAKADPSQTKLPTHVGPKVRHRDKGKGKITRNQLRKDQNNRLKGKKRKRPVEQRQGMENGGPENSSPSKKQCQGTSNPKADKKSKPKPIRGAKKKDLKDERAFNNMVAQYKKKMAASVPIETGKRWYE
ncbi:RNA-binding protein 28-like [Oratosquilla oratoria]|uniref:RNA-binding protein 28-like n=1 Tax=Oratosquilla oratoria TaxID=337810 RepID=UPI003F7686DB